MDNKRLTLLHLPALSPPVIAGALDTAHLTAGRLVAQLAMLRAELECAPMPDADPEHDLAAVSRAAILEHLLTAAETAATSVRIALGTCRPSRLAAERVQSEVGGAEVMLVMFGRELDWAPWGAAVDRIRLLGELAETARDAARTVRAGLGEAARNLAGRTAR